VAPTEDVVPESMAVLETGGHQPAATIFGIANGLLITVVLLTQAGIVGVVLEQGLPQKSAN